MNKNKMDYRAAIELLGLQAKIKLGAGFAKKEKNSSENEQDAQKR
ncbi:MAG: hypothetical protein PF439_00610 [Helicobacteraceae bacterium]|jgi:hypothetical protein|nr:hypothetical protein [Helicobacteraceae bacterium]